MRDPSNKGFWDRVAKVYTHVQEKGNRELYAWLGQNIAPFIQQEQRVLELACGSGQLTAHLADRSGHWTATDFSEKMVQEAEKRLSKQNVTYEVQDATHLTYAEGSFDVVLIANALHIMPEPAQALKEIKRVLKKNGILIAPTFVYDGNINTVRLRIMEAIGFKTFHKWRAEAYVAFVEAQGFATMRKEVLYGALLPECLLVCEKNGQGARS